MTVNGGSSDVEELKEVSILRATLLKCLACHLCDSLLRDATTISECLHSFCSDCITAKLSGGETETCPVCDVNLGPLPLEKLRPDHHLDVLTEKLFSKKRKLVVAAASNGGTTRRKERLLSSLGAQGPPALNPGYASRQTRALSSSHDEDEDEADISDDSDSPTTTTSQKLPDSSDEAKALPVSEGQGQRTTRKCSSSPPRLRFQGFVSGLDALASLSVEPKQVTITPTPPNGGSRPVKKRPSNVRTRRPSSTSASSTNGIWFVLESGDLQTNEDALPPLASPYLRVKDGKKMSVNHVKQYLVHKLSHKLRSEMDVEITCRGNRVVPSLPLDTIRDIWYAQFSSEAQAKAETSSPVPAIPSSKDFLMVLTYKRKTLKP